jgi:hypothetical protein
MKRDSLKLQESDWVALESLAIETGSLYCGKPSWRRLVKRIARGELKLICDGQKLLKVLPGVNPALSCSEVPRNAPCPCGSGKKFKRCHGQ